MKFETKDITNTTGPRRDQNSTRHLHYSPPVTAPHTSRTLGAAIHSTARQPATAHHIEKKEGGAHITNCQSPSRGGVTSGGYVCFPGEFVSGGRGLRARPMDRETVGGCLDDDVKESRGSHL